MLNILTKKEKIFYSIIIIVCICTGLFLSFNTITKIDKLEQKIAKQNLVIQMYSDRIDAYANQIQLIKDELKIKDVLQVTVTAYSPRTCETDDTPFTTAFMQTVNADTVAVSRNIIRKHGWAPGDKIYIEGIGIRTIGDLMNVRFENRIDLFFWDTNDALRFGKRKNVVAVRLKI